MTTPNGKWKRGSHRLDHNLKQGGNRPGLIYKTKDGFDWGRPNLSYNTDAHCFGKELSRSERPHILWKDGTSEDVLLANHGNRGARFYLKIADWQVDEDNEK